MKSRSSRSSRPPQRDDACPHHAFTLLELLIVIAMIVLLAALLLSSFSSARAAALQVQCASRLRAIGHAFAAYAADNDGQMVTTSGSGMSSRNWVFWQNNRDINRSALASYLSQRDAVLRAEFCCPATIREDQLGYQHGTPYPLTFSMNVFLAYYPGLTFHRIKEPSHKILVYDENETADDDNFWYLTARDTIAGRHGDRIVQITSIDGAPPTSTVRRLGNALFFDGHVELVDNNTCHLPDWNDPTWPGSGPPPMTPPN